ncbi:6-bladed beta-propeller [Negadavirga shengliensis]|uniref:6-bladed beta-propeller n=1 Tax=Negadavirga shengliensis TaxID=1389218 RepID=A0ABV9SYR7_9BACT
MRWLLFVLLFTGLASCQADKSDSVLKRNLRVVEFDIDQPSREVWLHEAFEMEFIPVIDQEKIPLFNVNKVRSFGENLAVLSRENIWIIDIEGTVINRIGKVGNGPGEYQKAIDFRVDMDKNSVEILDEQSQKIVEYDLKGNFKSEIRGEAFHLAKNFIKISEDIYAVYGGVFFSGIFDHRLIYFSKEKKKVINKFFPVRFDRTYTAFVERDNFWIEEGKVYFSFTFNDVIYELTPEGLVPDVTLNFGEHTFPPDILERDFQDVREFMEFCETTSFVYHITDHNQIDGVNFFAYEYKGQKSYGIYSADSDKGTSLLKPKNELYDKLYYFLKYPKGVNQKWVYFDIEPSRLLSEFDEVRKSLSQQEWRELKNANLGIFQLYEGLSSEDGNILVKSTLKNVF